jgi:hypothetical protein
MYAREIPTPPFFCEENVSVQCILPIIVVIIHRFALLAQSDMRQTLDLEVQRPSPAQISLYVFVFVLIVYLFFII